MPTARARLAADVVRERLRALGLAHLRLRCDLIGVTSVFGDDDGRWCRAARRRGAARTCACASPPRSASAREAEQLTREVLALYTCGPAGGGGVRTAITPRLASDSCFVPRDWLQPRWSFVA